MLKKLTSHSKKTVKYLSLLTTISSCVWAQSYGHRLYINPAVPSNLHPYIAAELFKQHIPATLVTDRSQADCELNAVSEDIVSKKILLYPWGLY